MIDYDPYAGVDWSAWPRALAQHHDHMGRDGNLAMDTIRAYDDAGYQVIVALDYAGRGNRPRICRHRLWPVHKYLEGFDSDEAVLEALRNIKLFVPGMEEVGYHHITSPFLTEYIGLREPGHDTASKDRRYGNTQACIDLINRLGGIAIIAHPTREPRHYMALNRYLGIEIFNAYYYRYWIEEQRGRFHHKRHRNYRAWAAGWSGNRQDPVLNFQTHFLNVWDHLLTHKDTKIWGFAVNDHYGPRPAEAEWADDDGFLDSGKILVPLPEFSLDHYRQALERGAFLAIYDGEGGRHNKNRYPAVKSIVVDERSIVIDADGSIVWIAHGEKIAEGARMDLAGLETRYRYIRAEITNPYGTVYTQPWTLTEGTP